MKKYYISSILILLALFLSAQSTLASSDIDKLMVNMINEARVNPVAFAEEHGFDVHEIISINPDMKYVFEGSLPSLVLDQRLSAAAHEAGKAFLNEKVDKLDNLESENACFSDLESYSYSASNCSAVSNFIYFKNFLKKEDAVKIFFDFLIQEELESAGLNGLRFLNPEYDDFGMTLKSTDISGDYQGNGYHLFVYFGNDVDLSFSHEFSSFINRLRSSPGYLLRGIGVDVREVEKILGQNSWILEKGMHSIEADFKHKEFSRINTVVHFDSVRSTAVTYDEFISRSTFNFPQKIKSLNIIIDTEHFPSHRELLRKLVLDELEGYPWNGLLLLNPKVRDIGLGMARTKGDEDTDMLVITLYALTW